MGENARGSIKTNEGAPFFLFFSRSAPERSVPLVLLIETKKKAFASSSFERHGAVRSAQPPPYLATDAHVRGGSLHLAVEKTVRRGGKRGLRREKKKKKRVRARAKKATKGRKARRTAKQSRERKRLFTPSFFSPLFLWGRGLQKSPAFCYDARAANAADYKRQRRIRAPLSLRSRAI